jgi:hypothetical protein
MRIDAQVEIGSAYLSERRRGGSTASEKEGNFEFVTPGSES